ncbi:MAG: 3-hydroxybutyrate dehydrogenase [Parvibaculaceae bacterium]
MKLADKTAIVTGAASGIGLAIARRYAAEGANVVIADLKEEAAKAAAADLDKEGPGKALGLAMDVTSEAQVNDGVAQVIRQFGRVDVLVSNAGIQIVHRIEDFPYEEWKRLIAIHLDGAFLTAKACLPHMYRQKSGSIIFMGSVHSKEASPLKSAYVAAKHGILGLARTLAKEAGPHGVRSNVICPGFVRTALVEKQIPEQARDLDISEDEVVKKVMLGNTVDQLFTTVEDVAEVALMLAAFESNALTGQSIVVSHGWNMN